MMLHAYTIIINRRAGQRLTLSGRYTDDWAAHDAALCALERLGAAPACGITVRRLA